VKQDFKESPAVTRCTCQIDGQLHHRQTLDVSRTSRQECIPQVTPPCWLAHIDESLNPTSAERQDRVRGLRFDLR
jgi:hypothetical protein